MNAYQQVGSFQVVDQHGNLQKNGGNVASYFCTPSGRVIHAVTGPVNSKTLLNEACWAVASYRAALESSGGSNDVSLQLALEHNRAASTTNSNQSGKIHSLLSSNPLPPLQSVFQDIFENVLGEKVRLPGQGLEAVVDAIAAAGERKLPILFILSKSKAEKPLLNEWKTLVARNQAAGDIAFGQIVDACVVVSCPLDLIPALSQRIGIRPFAASVPGPRLFVIARSDGRQLTTFAGWDKTEPIKRALGLALVQEAKEHPRTNEQLRRLLSLITELDKNLQVEVKTLIERSQSKPLQTITSGRTTLPLDRFAMRNFEPFNLRSDKDQ